VIWDVCINFQGLTIPLFTDLHAKFIEVKIMVENHYAETDKVNKLSFRMFKSEQLYNKEYRKH